MIKAKIKFPNNWDTKDQIAIIGTPETPHAEDLAYIYKEFRLQRTINSHTC